MEGINRCKKEMARDKYNDRYLITLWYHISSAIFLFDRSIVVRFGWFVCPYEMWAEENSEVKEDFSQLKSRITCCLINGYPLLRIHIRSDLLAYPNTNFYQQFRIWIRP
jgi:hypothetical protein